MSWKHDIIIPLSQQYNHSVTSFLTTTIPTLLTTYDHAATAYGHTAATYHHGVATYHPAAATYAPVRPHGCRWPQRGRTVGAADALRVAADTLRVLQHTAGEIVRE